MYIPRTLLSAPNCLPRDCPMKRKLTAQFVKHAPPATSKSKEIYWDESLRGFGLAVTNSGHKSWVIQYRMRGKTHRITMNAQTP